MDARLTRRASLVKLGGFLAGLLVAGSWRPAAAPAADAVSCVLAPEQTEGPYYIAKEKVRRNIVEGRPGLPLTLRATVVDASTCKPIKGAAVDVWHCDAGGTYSGFGNGAGNRTFLRGIQRTDAKGVAAAPPATSATRTTRSTGAAARGRSCACAGAAPATWARSRWACAANQELGPASAVRRSPALEDPSDLLEPLPVGHPVGGRSGRSCICS
jgi:Dioxygenase